MSNPETSLDVYMQRLDVICSVVDTALQPGGRATKHDLRLLYDASQRVVNAYHDEVLKKLHVRIAKNAESAG